MSDDQLPQEGDGSRSNGHDLSLLELLDRLVEGRGRVGAAEALGVNYRTLVACIESRRLSRRMRTALAKFTESEAVSDEMDTGCGRSPAVTGDGLGGRFPSTPGDAGRSTGRINTSAVSS